MYSILLDMKGKRAAFMGIHAYSRAGLLGRRVRNIASHGIFPVAEP